MVPCNIFAIIAAVKNWVNPCEVSTTARQKCCESSQNPSETNTAVSYQENYEKPERLELSNE